MKDSISLTYPGRAETRLGLLFAGVMLGMLAWLAAGSIAGWVQPVMLPGESVFSVVCKQMAGLAFMALVLAVSLWRSLVHRDYVFDRAGVVIATRRPSRASSVRTVPWERVEEVEARHKGGFIGGSYTLNLKLKNERRRRLANVRTRMEVCKLRDDILALRDGG